MLYLFYAFTRWWLGSHGKMLHHLGRILPWCQQHSLIPLGFCWHHLDFLPIWCSIKNFGFAFTVSIIFILGCFDTALWSSASSWGWHLSHFSQLWCSITRSNENRRRFSVCLHGAGPICKQIKYVYWGGQANEKRRLVWTSLENDAGYKITPAELLPICRNL